MFPNLPRVARQKRRRRRTNSLLIAASTVFFLSWGPINFFNLGLDFFNTEGFFNTEEVRWRCKYQSKPVFRKASIWWRCFLSVTWWL